MSYRGPGVAPCAPLLLQQRLTVGQAYSGELQPYVEFNLSVLMSQSPPNLITESKLAS